MRAQLDREKVLLILNWCVKRFGKSKKTKLPLRLRVYKSEGKAAHSEIKYGLRGSYASGLISIYLGSNATFKGTCKTVLHEYKHYLMSEKEFDVILKKLRKLGYNYDYIAFNHPHELRAIRMEKRWGDVCYNELKDKLYK
jgi:hypothetical protein